MSTIPNSSPTVTKSHKPRLAVFKFASCDGCQLQLLSCEDELLSLADQLEIVHFIEASSQIEQGPDDIAADDPQWVNPLLLFEYLPFFFRFAMLC